MYWICLNDKGNITDTKIYYGRMCTHIIKTQNDKYNDQPNSTGHAIVYKMISIIVQKYTGDVSHTYIIPHTSLGQSWVCNIYL